MVGALRALGVPVEVDGERVTFGPHDGLRGGGTGRLRPRRHRHAVRAAGGGAGRRPGRASTATRAPGSGRWAPCSTRCARSAPPVDGDRLPFTLHGTGALPGGEVVIDASASSQFVSGLLLSGARYDKGVTVHHDGKPVPSLPHIDDDRGHAARRPASRSTTPSRTPGGSRPARSRARDWTVEPDLSNAAVFLAAAAVTGGEVTVAGWPAGSTQPGAHDPVRARAGRLHGHARVGRDDRDRAGRAGRRRRRPARRQRADPHRGRGRGAGRRAVADPRGGAHPRPRDRPAGRAGHRARPRSAATSPRPPDGLADPAGRLRARPDEAVGAPTPTTGWPPPARCSGWSCPASRSTTSAARTRRSPTSRPAGRR